MYCVGIEDMSNITFYNFDDTAFSQVILYTYTNSSYTVIEDSTELYVSTINGSLEYRNANVGSFLQQGEFYGVKLADNSMYTIDSFKGKKEKCNTGFMCRDSYERLASYRVNGVKQEYYNVRIYK